MVKPAASSSSSWRGVRGSRHERGYGHAWEVRRRRILKRDKHLCVECASRGIIEPASHVDHIVPKAQGGDDSDGNLRALCVGCHKVKSSSEGAFGRNAKRKPRIGADGWPVAED